VLLPIEGLVDLVRLRGRLEKANRPRPRRRSRGLAGRLATPNFAGKPPPGGGRVLPRHWPRAEGPGRRWRGEGLRVWPKRVPAAEPRMENSVGPRSKSPSVTNPACQSNSGSQAMVWCSSGALLVTLERLNRQQFCLVFPVAMGFFNSLLRQQVADMLEKRSYLGEGNGAGIILALHPCAGKYWT